VAEIHPLTIIPIASTDVTLELVGGKGLGLGKLARAELLVPAGFVITTLAYRHFVEEHGLTGAIPDLLNTVSGDDSKAIESVSVSIRSLFADSTIPTQTARAITRAYVDLGEPAVAVRSSATAEDLPDFSFAGQQDTYLNVQGEIALLDAVRNCWASLWTTRAIAYRLRMKIDQSALAMGVVIQTMVEAEVSGILFTANPATGDRSEIVINASYGLGEAIVGGQVTPDNYVVDRDSLTVKDATVGTKQEMVVSTVDQGVLTEAVEEERQNQLSMSTTKLNQVVRLGIEVEHIFDDVPQDIEWASVDGAIYLLQSRPITNLPVAPLADVRWEPPNQAGKLIRRQVVENMPDPLSPLFAELYLDVGLEHSIDQLMAHWDAPMDISDFLERPFFVTVNGYAYCRADYKIPWGRIPRILFWYIKFIPTFLQNMIPQWQDEGLPAYLTTIDQWKSVNIDSSSDKELLAGVKALAIADADYWFRIALVMGIAKITDGALHMFLSTSVKGELISGMFLRGFPSKTLEAQFDLETISRRVSAVDSLRGLVASTSTDDLVATMRRHPDGDSIAAEIQAYLAKYGHQIYTLDFVQETQIEDPTPVLLALKRLVERNDYDIKEQQSELVRQRDFLEQQTRQSIGPIRRWIFRKLLQWAQRFGPYREEALFYMGAAWPTLRKFALELGQRLVDAGTFNSPDKVFYLTSEELVEAYTARQEGRSMPELGTAANHRWELREARKKLHPPPMVPEGRFKFGFIDLSFFETQKRNKDDNDTLEGFAVSPGRVTGIASVIMSPADFSDMKPDTILVCPTTTPAWTPLFSQASALVTDIGGILAHGSIVAREYGIPAVMGTGNITQRIKTGQQITVDGVAGTVTIDGQDHHAFTS